MTSKRKGRYLLGIDFGTLSARALLVDAASGTEVATVMHEYPDGVIEETLPGDAKRLPPATALQNPADYLSALNAVIPSVLREAGVNGDQIAGVGTAFTSCTMLPVEADGTPLCFDEKWRKNPHAWVKLWKHHAPQLEANRIMEMARQRNEPFIRAYGGRYSSEWFFSKLLETVQKAPAVYAAAARFIEAGDWLTWQLCGEERRGLSAAGFKAMWVHPARPEGSAAPEGSARWTYPSREFFRALHPKLENVIAEKMDAPLLPPGSKAGAITRQMAAKTGLREGTPVAVANIDAHAAVPACGVTIPGKLVMILGTSTCHLVIGDSRVEVEGMCGVVEHGVVPGYWGYEAGQAGVGDMFAWYVEQGTPASLGAEAKKAGVSVYELLESHASKLRPGESGLLALDWWAGCRSVLMDSDLSGVLVGLTTRTRPHEIYRALIEATAFGTRKIIDAFTSKGVPVDELFACGGLAQKSPLLLQTYADVTGRPIQLAASPQTCALGAALQASLAAGLYPDMHEATDRLVRPSRHTYQPNRKHKAVYDQLYAEYNRLHDYFGRTAATMKLLKRLQSPRT
ncbi:MAG: L-ribulokinase [Verrucomicrobiota bacterium]|jgi:L-ribulokinase